MEYLRSIVETTLVVYGLLALMKTLQTFRYIQLILEVLAGRLGCDSSSECAYRFVKLALFDRQPAHAFVYVGPPWIDCQSFLPEYQSLNGIAMPVPDVAHDDE